MITDISDQVAAIETLMESLDYDWNTPKVLRFMEEVRKRTGLERIDKHRIPEKAIAALARKLQEKLGQEIKSGSFKPPDSE